MSALTIILLVVWALSGLATIVFVLMHSGKGTGVSDMIAAAMYNTNTGAGVFEKNLDRLTIISSVIFVACILLMMLYFPQGAMLH